MPEVLNVKLSIVQVRLLREVTEWAAIGEAQQAVNSQSRKAQDMHNLRAQRLKELAEIFGKTCP